MRPFAFVSIIVLVAAGCSGASNSEGTASPSPGASPLPLRSCEERQVTLDGVQLFVQANVDGTPAQIVVLHADDADVRTKAYQDARKIFGDPHPDTRTETKQFKWGMVQVTDMCGRPVMPGSTPTPIPTPR